MKSLPFPEVTSVISNAVFRAERQRVIDAYGSNLNRTNLYRGICNRQIGLTYHALWYARDDEEPLYVKIIDQPGTLSGNIIRLLADLPPLPTHSEIDGETIRSVPYHPLPEEPEPDDEDTTHEVLDLPVIVFDEKIHSAKRSKYKSEVFNLLKIKGGSPHVVELLGRTDDGQLVFPRYEQGLTAPSRVKPLTIAVFRRWSLQLAEAVCFLHSLGIIHRDLHMRNVLVTADYQNMLLCDFEYRWGSSEAPEIRRSLYLPHSEIPYTEKSDVYCFGLTLNNLIMGNHTRNPWVHWTAPPPFSSILQACQAENPVDLPSMREVKAMLEAIPVPDDD
ncbi:kinase-like domain-containing protein [Lyophyllum atratum]|nr:kinase-like domain-containing protein [Lyophyllum atratum]